MPSLPPELLDAVVSQLDPIQDCRELLSLLVVSSDCWDAAARVLYRHVRLVRQPQLSLFLRAGRPVRECTTIVEDDSIMDVFEELRVDGDLTQRTRRAYTFIETLHITAPLMPSGFAMLWDATRADPDTALFPNVRLLRLDDAPGSWALRTECTPSDSFFAAAAAAGKGKGSLFNRPHVCVCGPLSTRQVPALVRKMDRYTSHGAEVDWILAMFEEIPEGWSSMRVYSPPCNSGLGFFMRDTIPLTEPGPWPIEGERKLANHESYMGKNIPVYYLLEKGSDPRGHQLPRDARSKRLLGDTHSGVFELKVYTGEDGEECPPCPDCGTWQSASWDAS